MPRPSKKPNPDQGHLFNLHLLTHDELVAVRLHHQGYTDEEVAFLLWDDYDDDCVVSADWVRRAIVRSETYEPGS